MTNGALTPARAARFLTAPAVRHAGAALLLAFALSACDEAPEEKAEAPAQSEETGAAESAAQPLPASTEPRRAGEGPLAPEIFTLANGLDVVVITDTRAPVVTHMVWYRVGAADEAPGKSGIAHFLEHLMFKGTDELQPGEFSQIVARNGGQENAFTSSDYTAYYQRVAKDRLPIVMKMEADRMSDLQLSDNVVMPERRVILEERRARIENNPQSILTEQMEAALYQSHPYGIPVIGWRHEIAKLTTEDAIDFYNQYYSPDNAILIVAGDITAQELRPLAEKYYGAVASRGLRSERVRPGEPQPVAARRVDLVDERASQPVLQRYYLAPSYARAEKRTGPAIELLSTLLGGGTTSRLYKNLVVEQGIAASAGAWYVGSTLDDGRFGLYVSPRPGASLEEAEAALDAEIERLFAEGFSDEELERARTLLLAEATYARDSQEDMARIFGTALTTGGTVEDVIDWPARVRGVTKEDVMAAARLIFDKRRSVTGTLRPGSDT